MKNIHVLPKEKLVNPNNQEVMFHEGHGEYMYEDIIDGRKVTVWLGKDYISKEKPKPIHQQIIEDCGGEEAFMRAAGLLPKQESIEEAAEILLLRENLNLSDYDKRRILEAMVNIAKWQAERMYSEEEVFNLLLEAMNLGMEVRQDQLTGHGSSKSGREILEEVFEQLKKK